MVNHDDHHPEVKVITCPTHDDELCSVMSASVDFTVSNAIPINKRTGPEMKEENLHKESDTDSNSDLHSEENDANVGNKGITKFRRVSTSSSDEETNEQVKNVGDKEGDLDDDMDISTDTPYHAIERLKERLRVSEGTKLELLKRLQEQQHHARSDTDVTMNLRINAPKNDARNFRTTNKRTKTKFLSRRNPNDQLSSSSGMYISSGSSSSNMKRLNADYLKRLKTLEETNSKLTFVVSQMENEIVDYDERLRNLQAQNDQLRVGEEQMRQFKAENNRLKEDFLKMELDVINRMHTMQTHYQSMLSDRDIKIDQLTMGK